METDYICKDCRRKFRGESQCNCEQPRRRKFIEKFIIKMEASQRI